MSLVAGSAWFYAKLTGRTSFAWMVFYGVGAYSYALATTRYEQNAAIGVAVAAVGGGVVGGVAAFFCGQRVGDAYALVSLVLQLTASLLFLNWSGVTLGARGVTGIPTLVNADRAVFLSCCIVALLYGLVLVMTRLPVAKNAYALRQDLSLASSAGVNVSLCLGVVLAVAGSVAGVAGALRASSIGYIHPSDFTLSGSVMVVVAVLLGGTGRLSPVLGAVVLVLLPEAIRAFGIQTSTAGYLRDMVFGLSLLVISCFRTDEKKS